MKKKPAVSNLFSFLNPFHVTVWYSIIAGLVIVSLLLYVLNRVSPKRIRGPKACFDERIAQFCRIFSKKISDKFSYHEDLEKGEGVVWWRTRDTRATCHNRMTVTCERQPLKILPIFQDLNGTILSKRQSVPRY